MASGTPAADPYRADVNNQMHSPHPYYDRSGVEDEPTNISPTAARTGEAMQDVIDKSLADTGTETKITKKTVIQAGMITLGTLFFLMFSLLLLLIIGSQYEGIISQGTLALSFGLRHAVDADHIAAIDNVTRKLVSDGKTPMTVGWFFSLGHSTVVVIMCIVVAATSGVAADKIPDFERWMGLWGASFSSLILTLFAVYNSCTAIRLYKRLRELQSRPPKAELPEDEHDHDGIGAHTHPVAVNEDADVEGLGCLTKSRCCIRLFSVIDTPWKMYPIGFLFGLGFDTATEVSLLAVTATAGASDMPWAVSLLLPLMFLAGMQFIDALNGIFMLWTYGYASLDLVLQVWFNLSLTTISAILAFLVMLIQVLGIIHDEAEAEGPIFDAVGAIGDNSDWVGGSVVAFFLISLFLAFLYGHFCLKRSGREGQTPKLKVLENSPKKDTNATAAPQSHAAGGGDDNGEDEEEEEDISL